MMKEVLWKGKRSRVSIETLYKPKSAGGWGLLNPRAQVPALKAKWVARWLTQEPKWADVFEQSAETAIPKKVAEQRPTLQAFATRTIRLSMPSLSYLSTKYRQADPATYQILRAWSLLNVAPLASLPSANLPPNSVLEQRAIQAAPGKNLTFGPEDAKIELEKFSVKKARRYIQDHNRLGGHAVQPLIARDLAIRAADEAEAAWTIPQEQWRTVWNRLHDPSRRKKEKELLYLLAHKRVITNHVRKHWPDSDTDGSCRRCRGPYEDNKHAFHDCPELGAFWRLVHSTIRTIHPNLPLNDSIHNRILCWPSVNLDDYPLVVHIHSAAVWAIYVTFCQLGDGESIEDNALESVFYQNFRQRGADDWIRACQRDKSTLATPIRPGRDPPSGDMHRENFKEEWSCPPHIETHSSGPKFGAAFHLPEPAETEEAATETPDEQEAQDQEEA
ncbi:hypothetical protein BGX28_001236 [Mortierella sp. GBA30]|nr:hypothetical protein BGX28_001236 [Mortierella sp. GBA30]